MAELVRKVHALEAECQGLESKLTEAERDQEDI